MAAIAQTLWLDRSQVPATHCGKFHKEARRDEGLILGN
jgi:hypothetical protein